VSISAGSRIDRSELKNTIVGGGATIMHSTLDQSLIGDGAVVDGLRGHCNIGDHSTVKQGG
jgi:hypothetical protein